MVTPCLPDRTDPVSVRPLCLLPPEAEALCSGCSVVAGRSVSMAGFEWFVSENSGMLAERDDAPGHLKALRNELDRWDQGARDPERTAGVWCERLHADQVAKKLLEITRSPAHGGDHRSR